MKFQVDQLIIFDDDGRCHHGRVRGILVDGDDALIEIACSDSERLAVVYESDCQILASDQGK